MKLYHISNMEIREPDIFRGRKNADFGQGFYLSSDLEFSRRWAVADSVLNEYELNEQNINIHRFKRDEDWFNYILSNRKAKDNLSADVIIGPVANDTIFETFGIISSGFLKPADALKLLLIGPEYTQAVIKTPKALKQLRWVRAEKITALDNELRKAEQDDYAAAFAAAFQALFM